VQGDIKAAMKAQAFEKLPALVANAESAAGLGWHPTVIGAKLIGDIEAGWQAKDAEMMGPAIARAKQAKVVEKAVLRLYARRYKQLAIENKLTAGLAGDMAQLLAVVDEAHIIDYTGPLLTKGEAALKKLKTHKIVTNLFADDRAAGAMKFGNWRENPAWKMTLSKKATVYVAINEDGELDAETQAKVEANKAKKQARYEKARQKAEETAAAAADDEKDEELKAAAADAARVFAELEEARRKKQQRMEEGDEDDKFSNIGVHVVRNTRESWIPGVLSGFSKLAAAAPPAAIPNGGSEPYGDDQAFLAIEVDPADGPVFIVPSTFEPGEEGAFTLSVLADCDFELVEEEEFDGDMVRFKGAWSTSNQGPRSAKNGDSETGKKFKVQKTWNKNPQFRVWLKDPENKETEYDSVGVQIVLSTPLEPSPEMGMHVMRNTFCQFYNEKIEVLAERYQKLVCKTDSHVESNEIAMDLVLENDFEVKKNGCERGFPFFLVPSLFDKKQEGNFQLLVYSDKPIVVQMLSDEDRKL